jgi:hypothetical protein
MRCDLLKDEDWEGKSVESNKETSEIVHSTGFSAFEKIKN